MNETRRQPDAHPDAVIAVCTVGQPFEATPIQVALGSEGIDSELRGDNLVSVNPLFSNAVGGIEVVVAAADAERAAQIIAAHRKAEAEDRARQDRVCPQCDRPEGADYERPAWVGVAVVLTLGAYALLYPWPKYVCENCGHKWH